MNQEKRFLVALAMISGILLLWTVLSPPAEPPPLKLPPPSSDPQLARRPAPLERTVSSGRRRTVTEGIKNFELGPAYFGIGDQSGGIVDLRLDGAQLLLNSRPGILGVEWSDDSTYTLEFDNKWANGTLTSTAKSSEYGAIVTRTISLADMRENFLYRCDISVTNETKESKRYKLKLLVFRPAYIESQADQRYQAGFVWTEEKLQKIPLRPKREKIFPGAPSWITSQGKSHAMILQPLEPIGMFHVEQSMPGVTTGWLDLPEVRLSPGAKKQWHFRFYAGPIDLKILSRIGLDEAISFGMFSGVSRGLLGFLDWSTGWLGNYGLSICLLSFLVWLGFSPITFFGTKMSTETMQKMSQVKPQEARIRKEYSKNPQKMQQELMQLYKRHGINPAAGCVGCLPLLFTWPIFIALFQVLNRAPQLRGVHFLWIRDLAGPDALIRFPAVLPLIGDSFNLLPVLATVAMFFQQKSMQRTQMATMTEEQKMQQKIFSFFPVMFLFFFYKLPAGFMLYWVINSGLMATQQVLVQRVLKKKS